MTGSAKDECDVGADAGEAFTHVAHGERHSLCIDAHGVAYSFGKTNSVGQLGRTTGAIGKPNRVEFAENDSDDGLRPTRGFVSSVHPKEGSSTGHSALLDDRTGTLWMSGCDRWQQLGLGSAKAGSAGYVWQDGRLWQDKFQRTPHVSEFLKSLNRGNPTIRDVALGGDHTLVLSSDQRTVVAFGKGGEGQLGLVGNSFVSAPVRSKVLSTTAKGPPIAAVCAVDACSMTIDADGQTMKTAGKCKRDKDRISNALMSCIQRASRDGLINKHVE